MTVWRSFRSNLLDKDRTRSPYYQLATADTCHLAWTADCLCCRRSRADL